MMPQRIDNKSVKLFPSNPSDLKNADFLPQLFSEMTRVKELYLDLSDLTFVNSAILGVLINIKREADRLWGPRFGNVLLINAPPDVRNVLQLGKLDLVMPIHERLPGDSPTPSLEKEVPLAPAERIKELESEVSATRDGQVKLMAYVEKINEELKAKDSRIMQDYDTIKKLMESRNQFFNMIAHDVRDPLASIISYAEAMVQGTYGPLSEEQKSNLENMLTLGSNCNSMLDDVLDHEKISSGKIQLQLKPEELNDIVRACFGHHQKQAAYKDINFVLRAYGAPLTARLDRRRIEQVVNNLINNAIKFTPGRGRIEVRTGVDGERIFCAVSDTGPGIPAEAKEKIFRDYEELGTLPTGREKSVGLGLVISKRLAELHGGGVEVESEFGKGAVFTVWLTKNSG
jgi:anti-anti-sigma factor